MAGVTMSTDEETGITTYSDGTPPTQERKCVKCGHWSCPCCQTWCDTLVYDDDESGESRLCCDGECEYEDRTSKGE